MAKENIVTTEKCYKLVGFLNKEDMIIENSTTGNIDLDKILEEFDNDQQVEITIKAKTEDSIDILPLE